MLWGFGVLGFWGITHFLHTWHMSTIPLQRVCVWVGWGGGGGSDATAADFSLKGDEWDC